MLHKWSIRTTLTSAGIVQILLTFVVGALGLVALGSASRSLDTIAQDDLVAVRALNDVSSDLLRSRIALERVSVLAAAGQADDEKKALGRANVLIGKSREAWKTFEATPKHGVDPAMLEALAQKRAALDDDGVQPEFAALGTNDLAAYHAIADTKISPMFIAYDNVASPVADAVKRAAQARAAAARERIAFMRTLIVVVAVLALMFVVALRFSLRGLVVGPLEDAIACFGRIADGDLSQTIVSRGNNEIGRLFAGIQRMQESLIKLVSAMNAGAGSIDVGAREIAMGNTDLSQRTEQQAASLQETASSMEQLTGTVRQNAENARQASQLAVNASDIATRGGEVVGEVVDTMQDIAASSAKIVDIISVIEGIAFQTNILALNAAVEAARAGEQGRGFAVVAGEVRSLAQRSASAAKEIKELINNSAEKVQSGSQLVGRAGTTMDEILQAVRRVTDIMGEISAASEEQSGGIEQVNRAVTQMDSVTQQNAALVEQAAAAAASLEEQTRQLQSVLGVWRTGAYAARPGSGSGSVAAPVVASASASISAPARKPAAAAAKPASAAAAAASQHASHAGSQSGSHAGSQSGSQAGHQAAASRTASQPASQPASQQASQPASQPASRRAAAAPVAASKPAATETAKPVLKSPARIEPDLKASASASDDADWETF